MKVQLKDTIRFATLLLVLLTVKTNAQQTTKSIVKHRIVMQLVTNDELAHKGLMKQLNNLKNGWGDTVMIEVVCHGPGIELLMQEKSTQASEIQKLQQRGIVFVACENTMHEKKILHNSILPQIKFVTMGIGEIVLKQEQGWSYIKAGM
jgi:intracellular sulfur oxidation DsrE/DsrF family protein